MSEAADGKTIDVRALSFRYAADDRLVLDGLDLALAPGERCVLVGANGAGKTTLLSILAGKHMIPDETVRVLGRPAFSDTSLSSRVAFIGGSFPLDVDIRVHEILARQHAVDAARLARLLDVLAVDPAWRMARVSDGQRRRVQLLLSLLRPCEVLLLDEVTTDLDVIARTDLLAFLKDEADRRGTTILYATHILDALDGWATHLAHLEAGRIRAKLPMSDILERPLVRVVERWLRGRHDRPVERRAFSIAVYPRRHGKVLVIRHKRLGRWLPPGGELEPGETPLEAARRELREETGLEGRFPILSDIDGTPPGLIGYEEHVAGKKGRHCNFVFVADVDTDEVRGCDEYDEHAWVTPDDPRLDLPNPPNVRQLAIVALDAAGL